MDFSAQIISWYNENKRDLPWRRTTDPYRIWLSEIILQQTRVDQGMPYYLKFVDEFPMVFDLAKASEEKVLQLWQGLGYYSRGRNLHFSAKLIVDEYNGVFPDNFKEIKTLKGVGDYTAAAIASFSFKEKVAAVDGNVIRVITRFFGIEDDVSDSKTLKQVNQIANELIPDDKPDLFNQAIMEFGALQCKPKSPNCEVCPLLKSCESFRLKKVNQIPFKTKKVKVRKRYFNYLVFKYKDEIVLKKRVEKDVWQNLYDFPLLESDMLMNLNDEKLNTFLKSQDTIGDYSVSISEDFKHILSHQKIIARFFLIELNQEFKKLKNQYVNVEISNLEEHAKPILIQNYLNKYIL